MSESLEAELWENRYRSGQYDGEPPIDFVGDILAELGEKGRNQFGLYVGCGNGRNYIPLLRRGLKIHGIDFSKAAVDQLIEKNPKAVDMVFNRSFGDLQVSRIYHYLVAIQVFQHGNTVNINQNFKQAHDVLMPGGLMFLRINSASTELDLKHHLTENNKYGGFTVVYDQEPKLGATRHFFTHQELEVIADNNHFDIKKPLKEVTESRQPPRQGSWSQWETIWQKR